MEMIGGASLESVTHIKKIAAGRSIDLNSSGSITFIADGGIHEASGGTRTIAALEFIELKCGDASIKLSKNGEVRITGSKIKLN